MRYRAERSALDVAALVQATPAAVTSIPRLCGPTEFQSKLLNAIRYNAKVADQFLLRSEMQIELLAPDQLRLNPDNDRHGPLKDEASAIQWLLENRNSHMRALAEDLANTKRIYEPPLVRSDGGAYVVFDGNRRMCCVKLFMDPTLAPSERWKDFFADLASKDLIDAFSRITCEVERDLSVIDEMLYRRHTGSQDGVGRSQWNPEGKSFFLQRTGKASVGLGEAVERALKAEQLIAETMELPWSNLERLFSSEPIRKRAGISFAGGSLVYLTDKQQNMATLKRIAEDMASQKIVLGDLWNNTSKSRYLDKLKSEGFDIDVAPKGRTTPTQGVRPQEAGLEVTPFARKGRVPKDKHLISSADQNPFLHRVEFERGEKIWRELQFTLQFDEHDNAIAVLMRVLLELAVTYYARDHGLIFSSGDSFARRVSSAADSMASRGLIDDKARNIIRKFESDKPIVSAHSMHQYVHNPNFHPSRSDMKAIWNVIRVIVINSAK